MNDCQILLKLLSVVSDIEIAHLACNGVIYIYTSKELKIADFFGQAGLVGQKQLL